MLQEAAGFCYLKILVCLDLWISVLPLSVETSFRETSDRAWQLESLTVLCRDLAVDCKGKEITDTTLTVKV